MGERRVKRTRKPRFIWQGVLILAPMLVLAKLGVLAIWQDKRMAQHDAKLRAQDLAEEAVDKLAAAWDASHDTQSETILIDFEGRLLDPRTVASEVILPVSPMSEVQSNLLARARTAEFGQVSSGKAVELFREFLAASPPPILAQQARYSLGLLFLTANDDGNARRSFQELLDDPSPAIGEAGGDLRTLALLKLAQRSQSDFEVVCSNAVTRPSVLTPLVLRVVSDESAVGAKNAATRWWKVWRREERKRQIYAGLRSSFRTNLLNASTNVLRSMEVKTVEPPAWMWQELPDEEVSELPNQHSPAKPFTIPPTRYDSAWFIERQPDPAGHKLRLRARSALEKWATDRIKNVRMPEYFGVSVSIGGHDVILPQDLPAIRSEGGGKGAGRVWAKTRSAGVPDALATSSRVNAGEITLLARVHLIGPELLFETQRERSRWFSMVIGVAALSSIIGFYSAWRAFHKQHRLAEMKSNFVSSVSHELRAPIASVRLMAEGLERGKISEPSKQHEYFRFINQECRRLSSMIENVLDFARIEQGRKQYEFEPTDVTALVARTVKLMEPYAAERGVRLAIVAAEVTRLHSNDSVMVTTGKIDQSLLASAAAVANIDGQAIQQALVNLIDNAIKHSPGGEEVSVAIERDHESESGNLKLSVSDRGPGIPPGEHERIFERFYRLGSELRRETPGVGIGLSIVKHIVEAHSGRVRVDSEVGQGSRFTIELPLTAEAQRRKEET